MPTESIQFSPSARPAVKTDVQQPAVAAQTMPGAVLDGPGVRVTVTGSQLDKLVAKVKGESEDARLDTAKRRIAIILTTLNALNMRVTEKQKNGLAQLEVLQGQLDTLSELLNGKTLDEAKAETREAELQARIDALEKAVENAIKDGEAHRKLVEELKRTRSKDDADLRRAEDALAKSEAALAAARTSLDKARSDLATAKSNTESLKNDIAELKSQIADIGNKISDCVAAIGDKALAALASALRSDISTDVPEVHETNADREKEDAKKIATDPLRIIREALDRMDADILRTIDDNRTLLV